MKKECPICNWKGKQFKQLSDGRYAVCPECGSLERHRFIWLYIQDFLKDDNLDRVLHVGPNPGLLKGLIHHKLNVTTIDIEDGRADNMIDLCCMPFGDEYFDIIICSHVLEHIQKDQDAIKEMHRVLNEKGFVIIQVPQSNNYETFECGETTTDKLRLEKYGNKKHVRIYGADILNKLIQVGWSCIVVHTNLEYTKDTIEKYGLIANDIIYFCFKSNEWDKYFKNNKININII